MHPTRPSAVSALAVAALSLSLLLSPTASGTAAAVEVSIEAGTVNGCSGTIAAGECTGISNPGIDTADQSPAGGVDDEPSSSPCGCAETDLSLSTTRRDTLGAS
jgi:hypothetical protein